MNTSKRPRLVEQQVGTGDTGTMSEETSVAGASDRRPPDGVDAPETTSLFLELMEEDSNNEISVWSSVDKCVFCNKFLNRETKLLECLHKICNECYEIKMTTNTGVQCECGTVSVDNIDFPIEIQLNTQLYLCPVCAIKNVEVLCVNCTEVICSLCFLQNHKSHEYKVLDDVCRDSKHKLSTKQLNFERNNNYINFCMEKSEEEMKQLKTKYKLINENIDKYTNDLFVKLSFEITKHQLELKSIVEKEFGILKAKALDNKRILQDLQKKNSYYISFLKSIENHKEIYHRFHLTERIAQKLDGVCHTGVDVPQNLANLKFDLEIIFDDTAWENFVTHMKSVVKVIISSENNVITGNENPQLECSNNQIMPEDETTTKAETMTEDETNNSDSNPDNSSSDNKPYINCSCCNQSAEFGQLVQCTFCQRQYHTYCHIPCLPTESTDTDDIIREEWKCTMCIDVFYSSPISHENLTFGMPEQKVLGRILTELYCLRDESDYFRELVNREHNPQYYEKITSPISLNYIRDRLQFKIKPYYTAIDDVINDMIKIFSNAILYYPLSHPCYVAAHALKTLLIRLVHSFLPRFSYLVGNI